MPEPARTQRAGLPSQIDVQASDEYLAADHAKTLTCRTALRQRCNWVNGHFDVALLTPSYWRPARTDDGYLVTADHGQLHRRAVIIASGACNVPVVRPLSESVPQSIRQLPPFDFAELGDLPAGAYS